MHSMVTAHAKGDGGCTMQAEVGNAATLKGFAALQHGNEHLSRLARRWIFGVHQRHLDEMLAQKPNL